MAPADLRGEVAPMAQADPVDPAARAAEAGRRLANNTIQ